MVSSAFVFPQEQSPAYTFVVFSIDKPPGTITDLQLGFLMHRRPGKLTDTAIIFPDEKPQSSWLKGKNTHLHVIFV